MAHNHHHHDVNHHHESHLHDTQHQVSRENQHHFDKLASSFEDVPWIVKVGQQTSDELSGNIEWIRITESKEQSGRLLDYACGTGVIARALAPFYQSIVGIDVSAGMLKEFDRHARKAGFAEDQMSSVHANLLDPQDPPAPQLENPEFFDFDTAVMSFAFHHVHDTETMLRKLVERLRPGGTVVIVDIVGALREDLPEGHGIAHGGFEESQMQSLFEKVGLENWGWKMFAEDVDMPISNGGAKKAFLARGMKPNKSQQDEL